MQTLTKTTTIQAVQFDGSEESAHQIEEIVSSKGWSRSPYNGIKPLTYNRPIVTWRRYNTDTPVHDLLNKVFPSRVRNSETFSQYIARKKKTIKEYDDWYDSMRSVEIVTLTGLVKVWAGQWVVVDNDKITVVNSVDGFKAVELDTTE